MAQRRTLYDRTIERFKNNKVVVVCLIALTALSAIATLTENVRDLLVNFRSEASGPEAPSPGTPAPENRSLKNRPPKSSSNIHGSSW